MDMLSYAEETGRRVARLRAALNKETDRGLILLSGTSLEEEMQELLTAHFEFERGVGGLGEGNEKEYEVATKEAFRKGGPLIEFSARNNLAFSLGLIQDEYADLELFARIRNKFIHKTEVESLSDPKVIALLKRFIGLKQNNRSKTIDRQAVLNKVISVAGLIIARTLLLKAPDLSEGAKAAQGFGLLEGTKRALMKLEKP